MNSSFRNAPLKLHVYCKHILINLASNSEFHKMHNLACLSASFHSSLFVKIVLVSTGFQEGCKPAKVELFKALNGSIVFWWCGYSRVGIDSGGGAQCDIFSDRWPLLLLGRQRITSNWRERSLRSTRWVAGASHDMFSCGPQFPAVPLQRCPHTTKILVSCSYRQSRGPLLFHFNLSQSACVEVSSHKICTLFSISWLAVICIICVLATFWPYHKIWHMIDICCCHHSNTVRLNEKHMSISLAFCLALTGFIRSFHEGDNFTPGIWQEILNNNFTDKEFEIRVLNVIVEKPFLSLLRSWNSAGISHLASSILNLYVSGA